MAFLNRLTETYAKNEAAGDAFIGSARGTLGRFLIHLRSEEVSGTVCLFVDQLESLGRLM